MHHGSKVDVKLLIETVSVYRNNIRTTWQSNGVVKYVLNAKDKTEKLVNFLSDPNTSDNWTKNFCLVFNSNSFKFMANKSSEAVILSLRWYKDIYINKKYEFKYKSVVKMSISRWTTWKLYWLDCIICFKANRTNWTSWLTICMPYTLLQPKIKWRMLYLPSLIDLVDSKLTKIPYSEVVFDVGQRCTSVLTILCIENEKKGDCTS